MAMFTNSLMRLPRLSLYFCLLFVFSGCSIAPPASLIQANHSPYESSDVPAVYATPTPTLALSLTPTVFQTPGSVQPSPSAQHTQSPTFPATPVSTLAGYPAPNFDLLAVNTSDYQSLSLAALGGRPAVLVFFTTWCPTCRQLAPKIIAAAAQADPTIQIIGIDILENRAVVEEYVQRMGITYPVLLDLNGETSKAFRVAVLPTIYFLDSNGRIVNLFTGVPGDDILANRIARMIGQ